MSAHGLAYPCPISILVKTVQENLEKTLSTPEKPISKSPKTRAVFSPHINSCGGWLYILCPQKKCMEIVSVPYLDAGKETTCPQCGTTYRIPTSYIPYICKCGKTFKIASGFQGIMVKCSFCGVTTKVIEGGTPARTCEPQGFIYFSCSNPQCRVPLVQRDSFRGLDTECPKCKAGVTLPYQSELDPVLENLSLLQFLMPVSHLKEKCKICGQAVDGKCPTCANFSIEASGKLLLHEEQILQFFKDPNFSTSAVLRLGEANVDIADRNFYRVGTLIYYELLGKAGEIVGEACFRIKSFSSFVTKHKLLRYRLLPVPNQDIWKKKREKVLARLEFPLQDSLFLSAEN